MQTSRIKPIHEALSGLELAAALVLLAEQEHEPLDEPLARLRVALGEVHGARELVAELASSTGRPPLHVIAGKASPRRSPSAAA